MNDLLTLNTITVWLLLVVVVSCIFSGQAWKCSSTSRQFPRIQPSSSSPLCSRHVRLLRSKESLVLHSSNGGGSSSSSKNRDRRRRSRRMSYSNILEDSRGHINSRLAENIWNWEQDYRIQRNLPKINYSIRSGLRLIDHLVDDILSIHQQVQRSSFNINDDEIISLRSDLIQEGLSALLDAMSHYRQQDGSHDFEDFAKMEVYLRLVEALDVNDIHRPIRVPESVKTIVNKAKYIIKSFIEQTGRKPSLEEVANQMKLSKERLKEYLNINRRNKHSLSMESTVSVYSPHEDIDRRYFTDIDQYELQQGLLLDNGIKINKDELINEFLDDMIENEGNDEAWIREEQIVGLLQDSIPDTVEEDIDDDVRYNIDFSSTVIDQNIFLQDMIQNQQTFSTFLKETLNEQELHIIQLRFGLEEELSSSEERITSLSSVAVKCKVTTREVSDTLRNAISKLRKAYQDKYLTSSNQSMNDDDMVDSV